MRSFSFVTLDVFTRQPLAGNQLAVITDASGLTDAEMQSIAREMNLSETTFVFPREKSIEQASGVKVRIFTVTEELPFAGHPTLGTAFALRGSGHAEQIDLDLRVGKVPVRFCSREGAVFGEMSQRDPEFGAIHDCEKVASALGISVDELEPELPVQTVSTGLVFAIVPFRRLSTLRSFVSQWDRAEKYLANSNAKFFYLVSRETESPKARLHARMIFYNGEDPATGSAAGCVTAWMAKYGVIKSEEQVMIEQGLEAQRPSEIFVRARVQGGTVSNVRVGGYAVEVMRGTLSL
ncbi:MAG TPA: PhzF family phenazine biosynthesis protein [Terriglobales bacterium]|nr:PhzF family phenazine biosynthesis protein [Terriglobales bacterium]